MNIPSYNDKQDKKNINENKVIFNPNFDEEDEESLKYINKELYMKKIEEENEIFQFVNNIQVKKPQNIKNENKIKDNNINILDINFSNINTNENKMNIEQNLLEEFDFITDENESNNQINNNLFSFIENITENKIEENKNEENKIEENKEEENKEKEKKEENKKEEDTKEE